MVSVDPIDEIVKTQKTYDVPFALLSDPDKTTHEAYKVLNAEGKAAIPSVFLITKDGKVKWAHADRDYKRRPHVDDLLEVVPRAL
jgi:peroxiredoxin